MSKLISSFYSKLLAALLLSFVGMGVLMLLLAQQLGQSYQDEVEQKLHAQLAQHVVHDNPLLQDGSIDHDALQHAFHAMMILGPSFEFYVLDPAGNILTFSAAPGQVKRHAVSLLPVHQFMANNAQFPIRGEDPRSRDKHKIFSVAAITDHEELVGYLYIIIGGEIYDGIVDLWQQSHIFTLAVWGLSMALLFGLLLMLLLFAMLTRPLRRLSGDMQQFKQEGFAAGKLPDSQWNKNASDEVERLGSTFNEMARALNSQYQQVKDTDELRRELISYVSHDLRTPLASLRGYLETWQLKHRQLSPQEGAQLITVAMNNAQHMSRLIEQLFELAHLDGGDATLIQEPVAIAELAQDVLQKRALTAHNQGVSLDVEPKDPALMAMANIEKLESVFSNLIDNAIRHCDAGQAVQVLIQPLAGAMRVTIKDSGSGIPAADLPQIFDAHFRASNSRTAAGGGDHEQGSNSGLGLAICKRIIELHGSRLTVSSTLGQGTQFSFELALVNV
ncbi:MAG: HAMP domain-containing sensor histidine kinase [Bermanella sp.]